MDPEPKSSLDNGPLITSTSSGWGTEGVLLSLFLPRHALMEGLMNNYLQGYLNEIYHLKQNLACTEEQMAYVSYERAKEIWVSSSWGSFLRKGQ